MTAVTLDEPNAAVLRLDRVTLIEGRLPYQQAALEIYTVARGAIPALFWRSKHREANGFVVGVFDDLKDAAGLSIVNTVDLMEHPVIDQLSSMKTLVFD